jgi:hypothetical protein
VIAAAAVAGGAALLHMPAAHAEDLYAVQERLNDTAWRIQQAGGDGYAGVVAAPETGRLRLYWKGGVPARVSAVIAEARRDVPVDVLPAAHTATELSAAAARLAARPGVVSVAPEADGSGLRATVSDPAAAAPADPVPVRYRHGARIALAASKADDAPPYQGAARWTSPLGGCSTGFGVVRNGITFILSAGHCAENGQTARDGGGQVMGTVQNKSRPHDVLLIRTSAQGRMYGGTFTSSASVAVADVPLRPSQVGNLVCRSSSFSDQICNLRVTAVNQTINTEVGPLGPVVEAEQQDHLDGAGNGDSGGSLFVPRSDGKVNARGTTTAIDTTTQVPCTGVPTGPTRICAWRMFYVDIFDALAQFPGAAVLTA